MTYKEITKLVNETIANLKYERKPYSLYEPVQYVLEGSGKRLRPVLMLLAYNLYKDDVETILPQAIGLETYHNYTLLHDDLMDKAEVRRGKDPFTQIVKSCKQELRGDAAVLRQTRETLAGNRPKGSISCHGHGKVSRKLRINGNANDKGSAVESAR